MIDIDDVIVTRAIERARAWIQASRAYPAGRSAELLAQVLEHPGGLDYTVSFVDGVVRPEDPAVAAQTLQKVARQDADFLPPWLKIPARVGGAIAPSVPEIATGVARRVFAALVGDLVVDVTPAKLGPAIAKLRADGSRLNLNLLGEAVLGDKEAERRLAATTELIRRPDVDYVSLKVSSVIGPHAPFGHEEAVAGAVEKLIPVYREAAANGTFLNLDMEEYKDLHLTIDVLMAILDRPEFHDYRAGIVLQSYLPDSRLALTHLTSWAKDRRAGGGAPVKVRIVKGANLSMERVDAAMHNWELTVQPSKEATDANYITLLDDALRPENIDAVHVGVAGQNLFTLAFAVELAASRGIEVGEGLDIEMLAGMATPQAKAVRDDVGSLLYYVPVVRPEEYDVAISYLVRRLEENATAENFMSNVFDIPVDEKVFNLERDRFVAAVELAESSDLAFGPRRTQNRLNADIVDDDDRAADPTHFENSVDTDPSLPANQAWARQIATRIPSSQLGIETADDATVDNADAIDDMIARAREAHKAWAARPASERAEILRAVARGLEARRGDLIEVAGAEAGKLIDQGDVEVSEAIDFANYYAAQALELEELAGATFVPVPLTLITPPWNFPIAIPAGGVLAALATGSSVIFKPAGLARRTGAVLFEIIRDAGVPADVVHLIQLDESKLDSEESLGEHLVRHEGVDQVVLTGSIDTARRFRSWRPDLRLFAETSGKNAIVVTPAADIDLAVRDVVTSAFGHAGQKCSASSLVICVGSVGFSRRFHHQLVDAVRSLRPGHPEDLSAQMGPIIAPAEGKLAKGLTTLDEGQSWAIEPKQLDEALWTPGVRAGVEPGSEYHLTEYFGPILGVMRADSLEEALEWQNATDFGLTAGLHSLDPAEVSYWLDHVQAGNVYVNRTITGAIVRRQPFGGWKRSAVGTGTKAGGPNYLIGLGHAVPAEGPAIENPLHLRTNAVRDARAAGRRMTIVDQAKLDAVLAGIDDALVTEFLAEHDPSQLGVETNVLRYMPGPPVILRLEDGQPIGIVLALASIAATMGTKLTVSTSLALPRPVTEYLESYAGIDAVTASTEEFLADLAAREVGPEGLRIRLVGGDPLAVAEAVDGSVDVGIYSDPVTSCGRVEVLPFVREQAISATNHRFGNHTSLLEGIL